MAKTTGGTSTKDRKGSKGSGGDVSNFSETDGEFGIDIESEGVEDEVEDNKEDEDEEWDE